MRELPWRIVAAIVSLPFVTRWLIARSKRTPYSPIRSRDGSALYMDRWWLFNAYSKDENDRPGPPRWSWLPSVRGHHILLADSDDHLHDHPWDARTILLRGWYKEEKPGDIFHQGDEVRFYSHTGVFDPREIFLRRAGDTRRVLFGEYHRISEVSPGGVYTLWFTWKYRGTWGFKVDGTKVPYRKYLKLDEPAAPREVTAKMYAGADSMWGNE